MVEEPPSRRSLASTSLGRDGLKGRPPFQLLATDIVAKGAYQSGGLVARE